MAMAVRAPILGVPALQTFSTTTRSRPAFAKAIPPVSSMLKSQENVEVRAKSIAGALFGALANSSSSQALQHIVDAGSEVRKSGLGSIAASVGLGTLLNLGAVSEAFAAQEPSNDSRGLLLLGIILPAIGWVLFNILQPALNQLNKMRSSKGLIAGIGIGAAVAGSSFLLDSSSAQAAEEIASIADADNRGTLLLIVILPALGWVLFNILQPALNQFNKMKSKK